MRREASYVLGFRPKDENDDQDAMEDIGRISAPASESHFATTLVSLDEIGLGGLQAQRLFAEVMSELLPVHIRSNYAQKWASPSTCPEQVESWTQDQFARFIAQVLACMNGDSPDIADNAAAITGEDITNWKTKAISELGVLRLTELFDIVISWEKGSKGGIEDLKRYTTTTAARAHVINYFTGAVGHRLLHPGSSTTEILQTYIHIIRSFTLLDPKGVLLDRITRPIRRYLRERDDTVRIIISGLLADPTEPQSSTTALVALAVELSAAAGPAAAEDGDDAELDFNDMAWQPDPVDAGPEYRKSRYADIIGTMVSLFDAKDVFVKEFQNILGERLLRATNDFVKEMRVLELLKGRFGEAALQPCEVMLYDILESRRIDATVKKEQEMEDDADQDLAFSAKILSRLFWPALRAETFKLPAELADIQSRFSKGFEEHKSNRKLTWLPSLGSVHVELQLEDRKFDETVQPWQASVIYAFQSDGSESTPVTKSAEQLEEELEMDDDLIENALTFWVGKLILHRHADSTYTVLESLPKQFAAEGAAAEDTPAAISAAAASASAAADAAGVSALRSTEDVMEEKMAVFWQFIQGMLTNQGQMPLQQIVMMLGFAVPGGFPFGKEDLRGFLGRRVDEGKLEIVSGNYKIKKG